MIIDVRDYRLVPGKLDMLVERFEALFMDEQERLWFATFATHARIDAPVVQRRLIPIARSRMR